MGYKNAEQILEELSKGEDEFCRLLNKIKPNSLSTLEWETFDDIFGVLLRFRSWYLQGCIDYHNSGKTPCSKNKQAYVCNGCPVYDLTPWRADRHMRCPTQNTMKFVE